MASLATVKAKGDSDLRASVALGPTAYIRSPVSNRLERRSPHIVILFGWTGSTLSGLSRYSKVYDDKFPCATQILVLCHPKTFLISVAAQKEALLPVAQKIEELLANDSGGVLVHAFSNGGCLQLVLLSVLLQSRAACLRIAEPSAIIFDSCPARYNAAMMASIISVILPGPRNAVNRAAIKTGFWVRIARNYLSLQLGTLPEDLLATQWDRLHRPDLFPWIGKNTKRLYLYSKSDAVIPASMVKEHLEEARQRGLDVYEVGFDESSHVSHAKMYPERYWTAVLSIWDDASTAARHKL